MAITRMNLRQPAHELIEKLHVHVYVTCHGDTSDKIPHDPLCDDVVDVLERVYQEGRDAAYEDYHYDYFGQ